MGVNITTIVYLRVLIIQIWVNHYFNGGGSLGKLKSFLLFPAVGWFLIFQTYRNPLKKKASKTPPPQKNPGRQIS